MQEEKPEKQPNFMVHQIEMENKIILIEGEASSDSDLIIHPQFIKPLFGKLFYNGSKVKRIPKEKPCLYCGKPKRHNNSFCSGECCSEYRRKKREARRKTSNG